jgi:hypothetical protein
MGTTVQVECPCSPYVQSRLKREAQAQGERAARKLCRCVASQQTVHPSKEEAVRFTRLESTRYSHNSSTQREQQVQLEGKPGSNAGTLDDHFARARHTILLFLSAGAYSS